MLYNDRAFSIRGRGGPKRNEQGGIEHDEKAKRDVD